VSNTDSISACRHGDFYWIRCYGKGSFLNSHHVKRCAEDELNNGIKSIVIDLSQCSGMDSTFMGTMAGIAMKLMKMPGGKLEVANPGNKNRSALEDLGLDVLMKIDSESTDRKIQLDEIEGKLRPCSLPVEKIGTARHVLDSHKKLCEVDEDNTQKFGSVLEFLEAEVKAKESSNG
jgi:anti-anti-sigma regulatory factor